ncbi:hypothetical protein GCM10023094_38610 [Rhodococcus olei]|uniref:Insoluble domain protein n=1 Tax=Rhodococcus olei TaxID=2161675 RepID=A0ABP8PE82_9NOCA
MQRVAVVGALPLAVAIVCSGVATAAPAEQGGVGVEEAPRDQPGVPAEEAAPAPAPGPAPVAEPAVAEPKEYWVAPPVEYDNVPTRPAPTYYYEDAPSAPVTVQQLHLPTPVEPVAPIEAPPERLRLGDYVAAKPNWLSGEDLDKTNNTAAVFEAQVDTFWKSIGVETSRADRIGAATVGGAALGGLGTAAALGVPAAVAGGLVGGVSGFGIGLAMAPEAGALLPVVGWVAPPVLNAAGGAAVGAAVAGIPVALVAGTTGAIVGAATGMAFGAGDTLAEPIEVEIPDAPTVDAAAITDATRDTVARVESLPGGPGAVEAVRQADRQVPLQVADAAAQVRDTVTAQPGGRDLVQRVEAAGAATATTFAPVAGPVGEVLDAVRAGLVQG